MSIDPISASAAGLSSVQGIPTTMTSPPPTAALGGTLAGISNQLGMNMSDVQSALKSGQSITSLASQQGVSRSALMSSVQAQVQANRQQAGQPPVDPTVLHRMVNRAFNRTQR